MRISIFLKVAIVLACVSLSSCSVIKRPEKTTGLMQIAQWRDKHSANAQATSANNTKVKVAYETARKSVANCLDVDFTSELNTQVPLLITAADLRTETIPAITKQAVADFEKSLPTAQHSDAMTASATPTPSWEVEVAKLLLALAKEARQAQADALIKTFPKLKWPTWDELH